MTFTSSPRENSEKMPSRVCMIAYTAYRYDGRVRLEAESLVDWGYEVFFLVPKEKEDENPKSYSMHGVTVMELNEVKYDGKNKLRYLFSYLLFIALASAACTRLFFNSRVTVFHVHNMPDILIFAGLIPRLFGCKLILDVHDTISETYQAKFEVTSRSLLVLLRLEERVCCALANKVICVNHVQRERLVQRGIPAEKIATVITMPRFASRGPCSKQQNHESVFRMVNHGTMSKRLGNDLIVQAAAILVHQIPGFELHIIGGGDGLAAIRELSKSLGLTDHVRFHEGVPWDELAKKLEMMDVGIVANRVNVATELMLPSKLIDFAVLGIPAIVPRLKAIEYYFSSDMVSYFVPEKIDSIVAATMTLYRDRARRLEQARNARRFPDKYAWDNCEGGLKDLYRNLFASRRPRPSQAREG